MQQLVGRLTALDPEASATLKVVPYFGTLVGHEVGIGLHHSTVRARLAAAAATLGYDPRTPVGRTRYVLARTLQRLRNAPPLWGMQAPHLADSLP